MSRARLKRMNIHTSLARPSSFFPVSLQNENEDKVKSTALKKIYFTVDEREEEIPFEWVCFKYAFVL